MDSPERTFGAEDEAAVRAVLDAQSEAWNQADLGAFMSGYVPDETLVFTSGGEIRRGYDEALAAYDRRYGQDASGMGHLEFEILEVTGLGPDAALVLGRFVLTDTPNAGHGVFSLVLSRTDAGWKVLHDHTSAGT